MEYKNYVIIEVGQNWLIEELDIQFPTIDEAVNYINEMQS